MTRLYTILFTLALVAVYILAEGYELIRYGKHSDNLEDLS